MSEDKKSYYAIIPANVRYDKELTANAKLLYGEITALTNEKGYCWASNNYFADLYGVTPQAISRWVNILAKKGYVNIEYERKGKEITQRKIFIAMYQQKVNTVSINSSEGINKKLTGYQQIVKENNTVNNTVNNKFNNICNEFTLSNESEEKTEIPKPSKPVKPKKEKKPREDKTSNIESRICEIKEFAEQHNLNQDVYENLCVFINWLNRMTKGGVDGYTLKLHLADLLKFAGDNQVKMLEIIKNTIKCKYRCFYDIKQNNYNYNYNNNNNNNLPINNRKTFLDL